MNTIKVAASDYTGPTEGYFTLIHHQGPLIEYSHNIMERLACIERDKPEHERAVRRAHILAIPLEMTPQEVQEAQEASAKWQEVSAKRQWQEASAMWQEAGAMWQEASAKRREASAMWREADAKLRDDPAIIAFIRENVSDFRWNGKELNFGVQP